MQFQKLLKNYIVNLTEYTWWIQFKNKYSFSMDWVVVKPENSEIRLTWVQILTLPLIGHVTFG